MRLGFKDCTEEARLKMRDLGIYAAKHDSSQIDFEFPEFPNTRIFKDKVDVVYFYLVHDVVFCKFPDDIYRLVPEHHQQFWKDVCTMRGRDANQ